MSSAFYQVFVHFTWSTWDRVPLIDAGCERVIYPEMVRQCTGFESELLAGNGIGDHVHVVVDLHQKVVVADLVRAMKSRTSHLINNLDRSRKFAWQGGYAARSIRPSELPLVLSYVRDQKRHHQDGTLDADLEARPEFGP